MKAKKIFSLKPVRLLLLFAFASVISLSLNFVKTKEYSRWISAYAIITDWKTGYNVNHILYFKYSVDGKDYNGHDSFKGNFPQNEIGDTVTVWYDPDDVTRVMISDTRPDAVLWSCSPFILSVPIALYIISDGSKRNSKRLNL